MFLNLTVLLVDTKPILVLIHQSLYLNGLSSFVGVHIFHFVPSTVNHV